MIWYNRQGEVIDVNEANDLLSDFGYKRVAEDYLDTPVGRFWVSTVWLGLDHSYYGDGGPPLIFETMVFPAKADIDEPADYMDLECHRYATEQGAQAGHRAVVERVRDEGPEGSGLEA